MVTSIELEGQKPDPRITEKPSSLPSTPTDGSLSEDHKIEDDAAMRRLLWKLDMRVLPPLFVLWFLSFIDRVNIGMARLGGMEKDLGMQGNQFNIAMIIFFPPFILMEVPANMLLRKLSPKVWLPMQNFVLGQCVGYSTGT